MIKKISILLFCSLLSACSLWGEDEPIQGRLTLNITAADNINANVNGQPSPLEVRVYQLSDSDAFEQSKFLQLYNDDQGALKSGLISTRHLQSIFPGESRTEEFPLSLETRYIAVIGAFANYREANNKAIYKVEQYGLVDVSISIDGINISISGAEDE